MKRRTQYNVMNALSIGCLILGVGVIALTYETHKPITANSDFFFTVFSANIGLMILNVWLILHRRKKLLPLIGWLEAYDWASSHKADIERIIGEVSAQNQYDSVDHSSPKIMYH